ncbi:DUF21 domain-containing protein At2g14520-like isoform X1 [Carex rostrata]
MGVEYHCCGTGFFVHIAMVILLVLFAGLMSGLTLGLMSLSLVDLEVLAKAGQPHIRKNAAKILPIMKQHHQILCTLLICNAIAMEALPIFLDGLVQAWSAVLISVTLILVFGEIIPQAVCTRYGLAIGAAVVPFVRILVIVWYPVALPISKFLDYLLGHDRVLLFRRAELQTLVKLHGNEAGRGGELTLDETMIINGALELIKKKAKDAMTLLSDTFAIDINAKLDRKLMQEILDKGHSRVPVYCKEKMNIIGLVLVKNLLSINPDDEVPVRNVTIRKILRFPEDMGLYAILNEFQKGHSHMAVVMRQNNTAKEGAICEIKIEIEGEKISENSTKSIKTMQRCKSFPNSNRHNRTVSRTKKSTGAKTEVLQLHDKPLPVLIEEHKEAIGIITMEDIIEEIIQEEIFYEKDIKEADVQEPCGC